jgi:hypothetical protein
MCRDGAQRSRELRFVRAATAQGRAQFADQALDGNGGDHVELGLVAMGELPNITPSLFVTRAPSLRPRASFVS